MMEGVVNNARMLEILSPYPFSPHLSPIAQVEEEELIREDPQRILWIARNTLWHSV